MSRKLIKIRIIKAPYQGIDKSKLPIVATAWYDTWNGMYRVDADFLPALSKNGMAPGDWPFRPEEVEVI